MDVEKTWKLVMGLMCLAPRCLSKVMFSWLQSLLVDGNMTEVRNGGFGSFCSILKARPVQEVMDDGWWLEQVYLGIINMSRWCGQSLNAQNLISDGGCWFLEAFYGL